VATLEAQTNARQYPERYRDAKSCDDSPGMPTDTWIDMATLSTTQISCSWLRCHSQSKIVRCNDELLISIWRSFTSEVGARLHTCHTTSQFTGALANKVIAALSPRSFIQVLKPRRTRGVAIFSCTLEENPLNAAVVDPWGDPLHRRVVGPLEATIKNPLFWIPIAMDANAPAIVWLLRNTSARLHSRTAHTP
jgi:hypothetical protein